MQEEIDKGIPCFRLVVIMDIGRSLIGRFDLCDFGLKTLDLSFQRFACCFRFQARFFFRFQGFSARIGVLAKVLDLLNRAGCDGRRCFQLPTIKLNTRFGLCLARIGADQPIGKMEQLTHRCCRRVFPQRASVVSSAVAKVFDDLALGHQRIPDKRLERGLVDECG